MQDKNKQNAIFFTNLRYLVNKTGLMDFQIAEQLGIHKVSFSRYFRELRVPKRTVVEKIEQRFQVTRADLFDPDFVAKHTPTPEPPAERELTPEEWKQRALVAEYKLDKLKKATAKLASVISEISEIF